MTDTLIYNLKSLGFDYRSGDVVVSVFPCTHMNIHIKVYRAECEHGNESSDFIKRQDISRLGKRLIASRTP